MSSSNISRAAVQSTMYDKRRTLTQTQRQVDKKGTDSTHALKTESMIRRNKLTLEHIMHNRGKDQADAQLLTRLHQELRNIEGVQNGRPKQIITLRKHH